MILASVVVVGGRFSAPALVVLSPSSTSALVVVQVSVVISVVAFVIIAIAVLAATGVAMAVVASIDHVLVDSHCIYEVEEEGTPGSRGV